MLLDILKELSLKSNKPSGREIIKSIEEATEMVFTTSDFIRPTDNRGLPGGLINLKGKQVMIIPDLHARREYLYEIIKKYFELKKDYKDLVILFLGDFFHTEVTTKDRWLKALDEYNNDFYESPNMDLEIADNLYTLIMLCKIQTELVDRVFFIKGNHDNIYNSSKGGNRGFRKYALEGDMVLKYLQLNYQEDIPSWIDDFENLYPILAYGDNFVASHSGPKEFYNRTELLNYKEYDDLIYNLTWTRNGDTPYGILDLFFRDLGVREGLYIAGHRHVSGSFRLNDEGNFLQIHNPREYPYFLITSSKKIDPIKASFSLGSYHGE